MAKDKSKTKDTMAKDKGKTQMSKAKPKDNTQPGHLAEMPYAREPLKTAYVAQRLLTTLLLVPCWALYYTLLPQRRPRRSWSIKQVISVRFTRRVYRVTERAGVTWYTRDPEKACSSRELRETRFEWADPLPEMFRSGVLVDEEVPFKRVGMFIWPKKKAEGALYCAVYHGLAMLTKRRIS